MKTAIREIHVDVVAQSIERELRAAASHLPSDYLQKLEEAGEAERDALPKDIILTLLENARYAESEEIATCQDTGMAVIFVEVGQDVHFVGGEIRDAIDEGVRRAYKTLRKSIVGDPILRRNTGDNTPALVHFEIVPGNGLRIDALMKGFGAESMGALKMLPPSAGVAGLKRFVIETVGRAGPNACPPLIVGVGIGGSFDSVALMAKRALLRPLGERNEAPHLAALEDELAREINALGIGPQGFGGLSTTLAVHIEAGATHIAALPVAVNLNCSAPRRAVINL